MSPANPGLFPSLRALPRGAWMLFLGTFLNKVGTFVVPFLTLYLTRQGYSLAEAGVALGAYGVGNLVAGVIGGHLADHFGRRATIMLSLIFMQQSSTFGLHVTGLGFPASVYGMILSMNGAIIVCCELPLTTVTRRFPARRVIALGYVVIGAAFALNGLAHTVPALVACMVLFTLGEMCAMPMASAYIADLAPATMRGRYMGVYGMTFTLALVVGPASGMELLNASPAALWLASAALGLVASGLILSSGRAEPARVPVVQPAK
jgi:MFS family permease